MAGGDWDGGGGAGGGWLCARCGLLNTDAARPCAACEGPSPFAGQLRALEKQLTELKLEALRAQDESGAAQAARDAVERQLQREGEAAAGRGGGIAPLEGELARIEAGEVHTYQLQCGRRHDAADPCELHFRVAESQFIRLAAGSNMHVTRVDYVVNPPLLAAFDAKRQEFTRLHGEAAGKPILAFHGTNDEAALQSILRHNFDIARLAAGSGDNGYYGAGIYFSEYTNTALGYAGGGGALLLCKVLPGRQFNCPGGMLGAPLQDGFDSHLSPDGTENVIFDNTQILPCYCVHYAAGAAPVNNAGNA